MFYTTLNRIAGYYCVFDYTSDLKKIMKSLGKTEIDNEPFPISIILDNHMSFNDALYLIHTVNDYDLGLVRLFSIRCIREFLHLIDYPDHEKLSQALCVAELYAVGEATREELLNASENIDLMGIERVFSSFVNGETLEHIRACWTIDDIIELIPEENRKLAYKIFEDDFREIFCS